MKIRILLKTIPVFISGFLFMTACEKTTEKVTDQDITIADDDAITAVLYDQAFNEVDMALEGLENSWKNSSGLKSVLDTCPVITVNHNDSTYWPKEVTIDFGTDGCESPFGHIRKGKIYIHLTGRYLKEGSVRIITFEDFYIDDFNIQGTKTVTNEGRFIPAP